MTPDGDWLLAEAFRPRFFLGEKRNGSAPSRHSSRVALRGSGGRSSWGYPTTWMAKIEAGKELPHEAAWIQAWMEKLGTLSLFRSRSKLE